MCPDALVALAPNRLHYQFDVAASKRYGDGHHPQSRTRIASGCGTWPYFQIETFQLLQRERIGWKMHGICEEGRLDVFDGIDVLQHETPPRMQQTAFAGRLRKQYIERPASVLESWDASGIDRKVNGLDA